MTGVDEVNAELRGFEKLMVLNVSRDKGIAALLIGGEYVLTAGAAADAYAVDRSAGVVNPAAPSFSQVSFMKV